MKTNGRLTYTQEIRTVGRIKMDGQEDRRIEWRRDGR